MQLFSEGFGDVKKKHRLKKHDRIKNDQYRQKARKKEEMLKLEGRYCNDMP